MTAFEKSCSLEYVMKVKYLLEDDLRDFRVPTYFYTQKQSYFEKYVSAVNIDIYNIRYYRIRYNVVYYFMGEIFIKFKEYNNAVTAFSNAILDNNGSYKGQTDKWKARLSYAKEMAAFKE